MIIGIIGFILAIVGIIGYYLNISILLYIGGVFSIIEIIQGIVSGQSKTIISPMIFGIIGMIMIKPMVDGFCLGLCIENIVLFILGIIFLIFVSKKTNG